MWFIATLSCAHVASAAPIAAADGERVERDGPVTFGMFGNFASADDTAVADLRSANLLFAVLPGDAVDRGTPGRYEALQGRLGGLSVLPLPGAGEGRGDRRLHNYYAAWEGLGVTGLPDPVPWCAFDLVSRGVAWRVLVLDADAERLGSAAFADELSWVPKVLADGHEPVLVLLNAPIGSLAEGAVQSVGAVKLHDLVWRHTDPTRLVLVAAGGSPSAELSLPGGAWGEAWLGVGSAAGPAATVHRATERLALEPGLDAALEQWFGESADGSALAAGADYSAERFALTGWWRLTVDGDGLSATLRMAADGAFSDVYTIAWRSDSGWRSQDADPAR